MALTIKNLTFSFALIFAINLYLTESTVTLTSTKFDNYIGIANKLTLPYERLRVYEAIWGEIRATGSRNLTQVKVFYDALLNNINSTRLAEQEQTAELAAVVREQLIAANAHRFAETLNSKKAQDVLQVTQFRNQLYQDYDEGLLTIIYEQAIDLAYAYQPADELYDMLDVIDSKLTNYKPQFNFRIRVNWTLYLYRKFLALGDINDQFVYKAAQTFHNLKRNQNYYKELTNITQRRIDMAFDSFTASLRHLFNTTNVCLENQNFQNYYIFYTPNIIGNTGQAVLKNGYIEKTKWYNSYARSNVVAQPNEFHLSYQPTIGYLYYRRTDWYVMVQRDSTRPTYMYWTPMLNKGFIMFRDLGRFMCATSEFNNDLKGFNIKVIEPKSMDDPMCQWRVTDCA